MKNHIDGNFHVNDCYHLHVNCNWSRHVQTTAKTMEALMTSEKSESQRRVYVLPTELVERIVAYQESIGLQSEVEAARRLLNDALRLRDDWRSIVDQVMDRMKRSEPLVDAARDVIVGHPRVATVSFEGDYVAFRLHTGELIQISASGNVTGKNGDQTLPYPEL